MQAATAHASSPIEIGSRTGGWHGVPSPDHRAASGGNTFVDGVLAFGLARIRAGGTYDGKDGMKTHVPHYSG